LDGLDDTNDLDGEEEEFPSFDSPKRPNYDRREEEEHVPLIPRIFDANVRVHASADLHSLAITVTICFSFITIIIVMSCTNCCSRCSKCGSPYSPLTDAESVVGGNNLSIIRENANISIQY
jgi:hypothetical protein